MVSLAEELKSTLPSCSVSKSIIWNDQENICHSFQPSSLDYVQLLVFNIKVSKISIWFSLYWRNICRTFWPPLLDFVRFFVLFWLRHQSYAYQVLFWRCRGGRFLISDHYLQWFSTIFPWQQDLNLDKCVSCFLLKVFLGFLELSAIFQTNSHLWIKVFVWLLWWLSNTCSTKAPSLPSHPACFNGTRLSRLKSFPLGNK